MKQKITFIDLLASAEVEAGEVFCGSLDSPLSAAGMRALKKAVRRKSEWDVIITSPLKRCADFANWLAKKHELPIEEAAAFNEMAFGEWEGCLPHEVMQTDPASLIAWWQDPESVLVPGGESYEVFRQRVLKGWQQLLHKHNGQHVLLVTHPGVVRLVMSAILDIPSERFFALHIEPGTLSQVRVVQEDKEHWAVVLKHGC